ncbi:MAG: hypothetical protein CSA65_06315 [Proteobacteria bacterium]|nr:MAG: hypothetical protein CSA65_06315 [Pseudomonadota bacterium]
MKTRSSILLALLLGLGTLAAMSAAATPRRHQRATKVKHKEHESALTLGSRATKRGVLLGRFRRCNGASILTDDCISRVHLLIVEVGEHLYTIDTGSTTGTWVSIAGAGSDDELEAARTLARPRDDDTTLELGEDSAIVRWTPTSST